MRNFHLLPSIILLLFLIGCGENRPDVAMIIEPSATKEIATATRLPTTKPSKTPTLAPTITPRPTRLTKTPRPTKTPTCDQQPGMVEEIMFDHPTEDKEERVNVYLPPCYDGEARYSVLYLLHGDDSDQDTWLELGMGESADQFSAFIIVMPPVLDFSTEFDQWLVDEIIPTIDRNYKTRQRALGGLSLGGGVALRLGLQRPDLFSHLGLHSLDFVKRNDEKKIDDWIESILADFDLTFPRIYIDVGHGDQLKSNAERLHQQLQAYNIPHTYTIRDGAHGSSYWKKMTDLYVRWYARNFRALDYESVQIITKSNSAIPPACDEAEGEIVTVKVRDLETERLINTTVYLPPCYDAEPERRYPVLYLLHGGGGHTGTWVNQLGVVESAEALIQNDQLRPVIMVMPSIRLKDTNLFDAWFIESVIPKIDKTYRTIPQREARLIGGFSLGAGIAIRVTLQQPQHFVGVAALSIAIPHDMSEVATWLDDLRISQTPHFYLDVGNADRTLVPNSNALHELLAERLIPHTAVMHEGDHSYGYWKENIDEYLLWFESVFRANHTALDTDQYSRELEGIWKHISAERLPNRETIYMAPNEVTQVVRRSWLPKYPTERGGAIDFGLTTLILKEGDTESYIASIVQNNGNGGGGYYDTIVWSEDSSYLFFQSIFGAEGRNSRSHNRYRYHLLSKQLDHLGFCPIGCKNSEGDSFIRQIYLRSIQDEEEKQQYQFIYLTSQDDPIEWHNITVPDDSPIREKNTHIRDLAISADRTNFAIAIDFESGDDIYYIVVNIETRASRFLTEIDTNEPERGYFQLDRWENEQTVVLKNGIERHINVETGDVTEIAIDE